MTLVRESLTEVYSRSICVQDGSPLVSTVDIQPVYNSQADVYSQHSTSVELDVTVPPWSGTEQINISFYSIPLATTTAIHKWRLCRVCIFLTLTTLTALHCSVLHSSSVRLTWCRPVTTWPVWGMARHSTGPPSAAATPRST